MGGKGQRRRERNYRAAHGGSSALPPPPDPSSLEALPAKLRKILSFSGAARKQAADGKGNAGGGTAKETISVEECHSAAGKTKGVRHDKQPMSQHAEQDKPGLHEKKKKRKRELVKDLRFENLEVLGAVGSKRKEKKKLRSEARKQKHKRAKIVESKDFRRHEEIEFGEVVEAPPKLTAIPKVPKTTHDVSQERLRLQAVEAYRKRRGWASRLGAQLPSTATTSSL